jgi:hypothetical protein
MSSHYGNIPAEQYDSDFALSWFNICVENRGNITIAPTANVQVFDPSMIEIFSNTVVGPEIATFQKDTIDFIETEFTLGADPALGKYTVVYNVSINGQTDVNLENNTDTTYFILNDQYFGRDIDNTSAYTGPGTWISGGLDGDMMGTNFLFLYECNITSMDVFINENTTVETSIIGHVMQYDSDFGDWIDIAQSPLITLDEANIGDWLNLEFIDPVMVIYDEGYDSKEIMVAIEFFYNEENNDIWIGYDPTVPASAWGTKWKFVGDSWITITNWNNGGLNIHLNTGEIICDTDTTVINEGFCTGSSYNFFGTELNEANIFFHTLMSVNTGCDSIIQLNLVENPTYFIEETAEICEGGSYLWEGIEYSEPGTYTAEYTTIGTGCDSIYMLELTVGQLPYQVVILSNPSNGILEIGNTGEISLSTSYIGTDYWVTMGAVSFTGEIAGTGSMLLLGDSFPVGTYDIWSQIGESCVFLQGSVTFVEDNGNNNLTTNITFGTPATNFPSGAVVISLYKLTTDIEMNEVIVMEEQQTLGSNGQVIFEDIEPGDYYLGSALVNPDNYNVAEHVYYQTAITHEDAISIPMTESTIFVASLHHPQLSGDEGSNTGGGIVGEGGSKSDLTPLANMVVILRDFDADEIIDVCVTNASGVYNFPFIPDNTNIQMYVTSFEHQEWTPFNVLTAIGQNYLIDFVVDGDQIYPEGTFGNVIQTIVDVNIYPNPTNGKITIEAENITSITVTNLEGQIIFSKIVNANITQIDLNKYSKGMYLIKVETIQGVKIEKIVIE